MTSITDRPAGGAAAAPDRGPASCGAVSVEPRRQDARPRRSRRFAETKSHESQNHDLLLFRPGSTRHPRKTVVYRTPSSRSRRYELLGAPRALAMIRSTDRTFVASGAPARAAPLAAEAH
jgi:hypothetical protein